MSRTYKNCRSSARRWGAIVGLLGSGVVEPALAQESPAANERVVAPESSAPVAPSESREGDAEPAAPVEGEAQPEEATSPIAPADPNAVEPPELVSAIEPVYPEGAEGAVDVVLRLTIDAEGAVTTVEVAESAGAAFDEAAVAAARQFRFVPARRGGVALATRILHRAHFEPPAAVSEPVPLVPPSVSEPAPAPPPAAPTRPEEPIEVLVVGEQSDTERLLKSADAVTVVKLDDQKKRSSDMGEVMARVPGVVVRRAGGLGSDTRFSLNGLYDDAVRIFVDGVPLWLSGYPQNIGSMPVNAVHYIEIYRGVVPLRLSADALGGAVNFVTNRTYENRLSGSYQIGSFGLHRTTALAQYRHDPSGFVARVSGFVDVAKNDYSVDVEVPDERGRLSPATVPRFHDAYSSFAVMGEAGVVERRWARRLIVRGFYGSMNKQLQHNTVMTVPYGEVESGSTSGGVNAFYDVAISEAVHLEVTGGFAHTAFDFRDKSEWVYDWFGERVRERLVAGETDSDPTDQTTWQNSGFARAMSEWVIAPGHILAASSSPLVTTQTGDEREQIDPTARDPLTARRLLVRVVNGVGYEWNALPTQKAPAEPRERRRGIDYEFQNIFNVKNYVYYTSTEEPLPGGIFREAQRDSLSFGVSDGFRYALLDWLHLKVSYEYATRLPNPYETFGDGMLVHANINLTPEVSHNANIGPLLDWQNTRTGDWVATLTGGFRDSDDMIVLLGNDRFYTYQNVYRATTFSIDGGAYWTSPGGLLRIDSSATYIDQRNNSTEGTFRDYRGDRIPNRPWLSGSWAARLRFEQLLQTRDSLEPFYQGRYTHEFYRGWESQGLPQFKQKVDSQVAHDAGLTYTWNGANYRLATTFEVQNFTDSKLFDDFGVQRPGRSFHWKISGDLF